MGGSARHSRFPLGGARARIPSALPGQGDDMNRRWISPAAALSFFLILTAAISAPAAIARTWTSGPTCVSDIPWSEFQKRLGLRLPPGYELMPKVDPSVGFTREIPPRWDWREHDGVTPVKDQGQCGSCWAFASVGALEGCARIDDHVIYDLSEQQLISCNAFGYGCGGGWFEGCYEVFHDPGAVTEECMPYQASDGIPCIQAECVPVAKASAMITLVPTTESLKSAILEYGPIAVAMTVFSDFTGYTGGCYDNPQHGDVNHAVVMLGWDDSMCGGSWICKNSWSEGWGDYGYFHITYGSADIGTGAVAFVHVPGSTLTIRPRLVATTTDGSTPFLFSTEVASIGGVQITPGSVRLAYRVNGGEWQTDLPMPQASSNGIYVSRVQAPPKPATIDYYFRAADVEGHESWEPRQAPDSAYTFDLARYFDDFEDGGTGWTIGDSDDDATSGVWECVEPVGTTAQPGRDMSIYGTKCWVTGQHVDGEQAGYNDVDGGKTTLHSAGYDLTGAGTAVVKYWRWYSNDKGSYPGEDPWIVQARNDDGPWVDIENTVASSDAWIPIRADLKQLLGNPLGVVTFRFVAEDRGDGPSCVEAAIDDFTILSEDPRQITQPIETPSPRMTGLLAVQANPNPTAGRTTLTFELPRDTFVRLAIYGVDGRIVRRLATGSLPGGSHRIVWDGRDDGGRPVASGPYYCISDGGGGREIRQVLVVR